MYESPILITQIGDQIDTELTAQEEAFVFSVVKRIYVDVDKDELIKALVYDRDQYNKGYFDGRAARDAEIVRCKDCKHKYYDSDQIICQKLYCCDGDNFVPSEEDFCSHGERSEECQS